MLRFLLSLIVCTLISGASVSAQDGDDRLEPIPVPGSERDDARAKIEFELGKKAYSVGSWDEAVARFERAYELSGRPALLYNIGQSADRAQQDGKALSAFEEYLRVVEDSPNHEVVRNRVKEMRNARKERQARFDLIRLKRENREAELAAELSREKSNNKVTKKWWFWTLLSVAAVGIGVGVFFIVDSRDRGFVGGLFGEGGVVASRPLLEF